MKNILPWFFLVIAQFNLAHAAPMPSKYLNIRIFAEQDSQGSPKYPLKPYNACKEYGGIIKYNASGTITAEFGSSSYSFNIIDIANEAAQKWNVALRNAGCEMKIIAASNPNDANFKIGRGTFEMHTLPVVTFAKGLLVIPGIEPGIYFNKKIPAFTLTSQETVNDIKKIFAAGTSEKQIAHMFIHKMVLHEFGHAFGLAHPFEPSPDAETYQLRNKRVLQSIKQNFSRPPIMIAQTQDYLPRLSSMLMQRIIFQDIDATPQEAIFLSEVAKCSNDANRISSINQGNDEECEAFENNMHVVYPYSGIIIPAIQPLLLN